MLSFERVTSRLSEGYSLQSFNLELKAGACVGLYGPNGCGKSTLLHLLAGVVSPSVGWIILQGSALGRSLPRNFREGVVLFPQANPFAQELSLRQLTELVDHQMQRRRDSQAYVRRGAETFFEAGADIDSPLANLSYGECRSASLKLWLNLHPKLLLLDEPFTGLNDRLLGGLTAAVRRTTGGCVSFIVDHNLERLGSICSSIWKFEGGEIHREPN